MAGIMDPLNFLQNLGMPEILLWLLGFALVYGLLQMVKIPTSKAARLIISVSLAFLIILSTPTVLIEFMYTMSSSLVLVVLGLLLIVIFFEVAGIRAKVKDLSKPMKDKEGNTVDHEYSEVKIFERYGKLFAVAFGIIVLLIFVSSGGLLLLGIEMPALEMSDQGLVTIGFFMMIILGIVWMISNPDK